MEILCLNEAHTFLFYILCSHLSCCTYDGPCPGSLYIQSFTLAVPCRRNARRSSSICARSICLLPRSTTLVTSPLPLVPGSQHQSPVVRDRPSRARNFWTGSFFQDWFASSDPTQCRDDIPQNLSASPQPQPLLRPAWEPLLSHCCCIKRRLSGPGESLASRRAPLPFPNPSVWCVWL